MFNGIKYQIRDVWEHIGYELYQQLFPKWKAKNIEHLIIVSDGALSTLPFEALVTQPTDPSTPLFQVPFLEPL